MKPTQEDIDLAAATEKQLGLPAGALVGFVAEGGQIDGRARAKVLDAYGIDAKISPRNRIEAAGLALQDALSDNKGDPSLALAELHSGADRAKWNKATTTFASRALGARAPDGAYLGNRPATPTTPAAATSLTGQRSASGVTMTQQVGNRSASGMTDPRASMQTPAPSTDYGTEQSIEPDAPPAAAPLVAAARTATNPAAAGEMEAARPATAGMLAAYRDGRMPEARRAEFERLVSGGAITVPADFEMATSKPTILENIVSAPGRAATAVSNAVTGNDRRTEETESKPDWMTMPSTAKLSQAAGLAFLSASPAEALQILQANVPGVQVRKDEKGNLFATDPADGVEYAVKPGFRATDIPRAIVSTVPFLATGGAGGIAAQAGRAAATQAAIEAAQTTQGGEFNKLDVGLAGAGALIAPAAALVGRGGRAAANTALEAVPGFGSAVAKEAATDATATLADDAARAAASTVDDVTKVVPAPVGAVDDVTRTATAPVAAEAIKQDVAGLIRAATGKGKAAEQAKRDLAKLMDVNPEAVKAAERLGVELPADVLANNVQLRNIVGSMRAKVGTKAEADFAQSMGSTVAKLDEALADLGAEASPAGFSDRVLDRFKEVQEGLESAAQTAYRDVDKVIKKSDNVSLDNLAAAVEARKKDMGGALKGIDADMAAIVERAKVMPDAKTREGVLRSTFGVIKDEKAQIRRALSRMESAYGSADENVLKEYQRALVADELDNVARIGGDELVERARLANRLWAQKKEVDEKITAAFGKKESGDVSRLLLGAVKDASQGSTARLNKLLETLPEELHGEALMTALGSLSRAKGGASAGSFGAAEFTSLFRGLRQKGNEKLYARIAKAVGPEREAVLRDVYEISRRITDARASIKGTGKDAQNVLENLAAENVVGAIFSSSLGKQAARGAGAVVGAAAGGLPGAGIGGAAADYVISKIATGGKEQVVKGGELLMSPEFKALAVELATKPQPAKEAVRAVVASKPFRAWAKAANLPREPLAQERWLMSAIQGARTPTKDAVVREDR